VLAGLPGSGKSSLAKLLSQGGSKEKQEWTVASTDDLGRKQCLEVVGNVAAKVSQGKAGGIIVDACNISESKRC
jgi:adenylate kinase family enzyme